MDNAKLASLGKIQLQIHRLTGLRRTAKDNNVAKLANTDGRIVVNEKAKKALITHTVEFN